MSLVSWSRHEYLSSLEEAVLVELLRPRQHIKHGLERQQDLPVVDQRFHLQLRLPPVQRSWLRQLVREARELKLLLRKAEILARHLSGGGAHVCILSAVCALTMS